MGKLLNQEEMREVLGLSKVAFVNLRKQGMPHYRLTERLLRFNPDEVLKWLRERTEGSEKQAAE